MKFQLIGLAFSAAGCSFTPLEIVSSGDVILTGHRAGCFVGCKWKFQEPDGTKCRGLGGEAIEGQPLNISVNCSGRTEQAAGALNLLVEAYTKDGSSDAVYNGNAVVVNFK